MDMEYKSDHMAEKKHLERTMTIIRESLEAIIKERNEKKKLLAELSRKFSSATPEFYNDMPITAELIRLYGKMAQDYEKALNKPYFGKIIFDIMPEGENHILYIGKHGINDFKKGADAPAVVVDWRASVAELYYSTSFGKTGYDAPGGYIDVNVRLKTSFDIENGELIGIYDSDIMANDDLLIKYLSKNKDSVLTDIVATIQQDQNTIIRLDPFRNLVVQGVAGSGKTTVAIHRIAYLLYNYAEQLNMDNVFVIASSRLFLNYITSMLPDLDVPSIRQGTISEFLAGIIREYDPNFRFTLTAEDNDRIFEYEDILRLTGGIKEYFNNYEDEFYEDLGDIEFFGLTIMSRNFISEYVHTHTRLRLLDKAAELDMILRDKILEMKDIIITHIADNRENTCIRRFCRDVLKLGDTVIFAENISGRFSRLAAQYKDMFTKKLRKLDHIAVFLELCAYNNNRSGTLRMSVRDLSCLLLIINEIKHLESVKKIRHIVIDEAQDFGLTTFYSLKNVFDKANFTLVGDVMQNISTGGLASWNGVLEHVFANKADFRTLRKSYRNTIQISSFARRLLEAYSDGLTSIEPVIRNGREVAFYDTSSIERRISDILFELHSSGYGISAVICKSAESARRLYNKLKDSVEIKRLDRDSESLTGGNYIIALGDSKGLEFDAVILPDFDSYDLYDTGGDLKKVYVAVTRALHELHIFTGRDEIRKLGADL